MAYRSPLHDVPALAFSSDSATPSACRLSIKFSEVRAQASILLSFFAHVHNSADKQQVVLIYDADQLVPGTSFLRPATEDLSQAEQSRLARSSSPAFKTLQLKLRQPCTVRCLPTTGCIAPKTGHETQLYQLRDLARALDICLVFDHIHLHVNQYAAFHHLVNRPESLAGVPYRGELTRKADWTVFVPLEDVAADSPPPYSKVSAKRYRAAGGSSSPEPLPLKRKRAIPAVSTRTDTAIPAAFDPLLGSPTERATTTASPSPLLSPSPYKPTHVHDVIENVLNTMIPMAIEKALPKKLSDLFAVPLAQDLKLDAATPIGTRITACLVADAKPRMQAMLEKMMQEYEDNEIAMRRYTEAQLDEDLEDHKLDVKCIVEEGLAELRDEGESLMQQVISVADAKTKEMDEGIQELVNERLMDVKDRLKGLAKENRPLQQKMSRNILDAQNEGNNQRATSSPL